MRYKNKKIGLVGYTGERTKSPIIGGQMSKTKGIIYELKKHFNSDSIDVVDTSNWKNETFWLVKQCIYIAKNCDPIIIMPNKNGIKFILPLFALLKIVFGYKLAYPIVGGWLPNLLKNNKVLRIYIKKINYLLPETNALKEELKEFDLKKIDVMPIFSTRSAVEKNILPTSYDEPFKFCTFSRVLPDKGIDDAIKAIELINHKKRRVYCTLDVWGPIDESYKKHYEDLFRDKGEFTFYKGVLKEENGLEKLSNYFMMLFPTYYAGEGFPTSVCESFSAGLPVIASNWRFNNELVHDNETGYIIPVHDVESLADSIERFTENVELVMVMKGNVLEKSKLYLPEEVMKNLNLWIQSNFKN